MLDLVVLLLLPFWGEGTKTQKTVQGWTWWCCYSGPFWGEEDTDTEDTECYTGLGSAVILAPLGIVHRHKSTMLKLVVLLLWHVCAKEDTDT